MAGPGNCHTHKVQVEAHVAANLWVVLSQAFLEDLSHFADNGPQECEVTTTFLGPTSPLRQLVKKLRPCVGAEPSTPPVSNLYLPDDMASWLPDGSSMIGPFYSTAMKRYLLRQHVAFGDSLFNLGTWKSWEIGKRFGN